MCQSLTPGPIFVFMPMSETLSVPMSMGRFGDMLMATAKHPAMLLYLNNAQSIVPSGELSTLDYLRRGGRNRTVRDARSNLNERCWMMRNAIAAESTKITLAN